MDEKIGRRLALYRIKKGYSQEELAYKLNISRQLVSKWETGESSPSTDNLITLSKLYEVSLDDLINKDPDEVKKGEKKQNYVSIGKEGVHVVDDENEVHIDMNGIHVNGDEYIKGETMKKENNFEYFKGSRTFNIVRASIVGALSMITLIAYILLGCILKDGEGWRIYWTLFFLIPIVDSLFACFMHKKITDFSIVFLALFIFLFIGMLTNIWHPTWIAFLAIPLFYIAFGPVDNAIRETKKHDDSVVSEQ